MMTSRHTRSTSSESLDYYQASGEEEHLSFLSKEMSSSLIIEYISLVTLLSQFNILSVRADFAAGKFRLPKWFEVSLQELDAFRLLIVPPWATTGLIKDQLMTSLSTLHSLAAAVGEVNSTEQVTLDETLHPARTFKQWRQILRHIGLCPYWRSSMSTSQSGLEPAPPQSEKSVSTKETATDPVMKQDAWTDMGDQPVLPKPRSVCTKKIGFVRLARTVAVQERPHMQQGDQRLVDVEKGKDQHEQQSGLCGGLSADTLTKRNPQEVGGLDSSATSKEVAPASGPLTQLMCEWCKRKGHVESTCYRKLGLCLICGGMHKMNKCSRFVRSLKSFAQKCPLCSGGHLGKHCKLQKPIRKFCHWCGNYGHSENHCWVRYDRCHICGDPGHQLRMCTRIAFQGCKPKPLTFPPWCLDCGSHHLGTDCECPFQE